MNCDQLGVHTHACSALVNGSCNNGFPVRRGCMVGHFKNPGERWWQLKPLPHCIDDDYVLERNTVGKTAQEGK